MLFAAFPSIDLSPLAWVGLVPLFFVLSGKRPVAAFLLTYLGGIVFLLGIFDWILKLPGYTLLHHAILAIYLGFFFAVFGFVFAFLSGRFGFFAALFIAPFLWVPLEFARSNFSFLALPWGLLAHSQYRHPVVIQLASVAGAYGISFLIVLVNSTITAMIYPWAVKATGNGEGSTRLTRFQKRAVAAGLLVLLVGLTVAYGHTVTSRPIPGDRLQIAVVQGNIEQSKKWDPKYASMIMKTYTDLTIKAAEGKPALIVWPESATPRSISTDARLRAQIREVSRSAGAHLLLGSSQLEKFRVQDPKSARYLNSAFLISPEPGETKAQRYDKIRLLPFGEYLPYKDTIPWLHLKVPEVGNYLAGKKFTVFDVPPFRFGVTICWENIFPDLVREFVRHGAQFIVNVTNEAWFGPGAAPHQFLSMSVFRAVENRIFVVRCANTGISCFIDPCGRVLDRVRDQRGVDIFVSGVLQGTIVAACAKTLYAMFGDWLVLLCLMLSLTILLFALVRRRHIQCGG
jgi:apolipoprotein N-acyltransferase